MLARAPLHEKELLQCEAFAQEQFATHPNLLVWVSHQADADGGGAGGRGGRGGSGGDGGGNLRGYYRPLHQLVANQKRRPQLRGAKVRLRSVGEGDSGAEPGLILRQAAFEW